MRQDLSFSAVMSEESCKCAMEKLKEDLRNCQMRRLEFFRLADEEQEKIAFLRHSLEVLSKLCNEPFEDEKEMGLTAAIRMALKSHGGCLNARQVKVQIERLGFSTANYKNVLATIHTVLKRLARNGELDASGKSEGRTAYRWQLVQSAKIDRVTVKPPASAKAAGKTFEGGVK